MAGTNTLDAFAASLIAAGIGQGDDSSRDWFISVGIMPDSGPTTTAVKAIADRQICLYETPGMPPDPSWAVVYPGIQLVVRGKENDYQAVRNIIERAWQQLHANEVQLSDQFVYCYATHSGPLQMGIDEKKRIRLAWNFRMMRNTQSAT